MQLSAELPEGEGSHPPGAYFSHAGKVGKRALRGSAPKDPNFWNRVVEGFISQTVSVERLPTNLGGFVTAPVGLLCSGYQNRKVVVSRILMLFIARWRFEGKAWRSRKSPHQARYRGRCSLDARLNRA